MKVTRERFSELQKAYEPSHVARHVAAYELCLQHCAGKRVLDLGCADGYGSFLLSKKAKEVVGVDKDEDSIVHANKTYGSSKVSFISGDACSLPKLNPFDIIASFQLIEHISRPARYLDQIHRNLKPNGIVFLTTPNRELRLRPGQKPWNRFHCTEYSAQQLRKLLKTRFRKVTIKGLTARKPTYDLEMNRLRLRRRIADIDPFGLYNYIPQRITMFALSLIRRLDGSLKNNTTLLTTQSFLFTDKNIDQSLDLVAICQKISTS